MSENLATNLLETTRRHADRVAVRLDGVQLTYADLDQASARLAGWLRDQGIRPGDRVGIMLPNVPEFAVVYYGILRAGGVVVPMNVLFKEREVSYTLADAGARILFAWTGFAAEAEAGAAASGARCIALSPGSLADLTLETPPSEGAAHREPSDTAVILYTSGTTGRPKGAELTHANLRRNVQVAQGVMLLTPESVVLGILPLFHSFGQTCGLNASVATGATLTLLPRFEPGKALEVIARDRVTVLQAVPTMYGALLNYPQREAFDTSSLRLGVSGGAALPVELLRGFEAAFDCIVLEGYGLSETSPIASFNHPDRERKAGSIGQPVEGVEMRLVDEAGRELGTAEVGEIVIRGHNVMKGYWQRPEATAEAITAEGWFRTGDLAKRDDEGYFFIVDRKKDMIIRGGYNVYPREVEEVLYQHPAVREAAVLGIPHQELGEEVCAAVVLRPGSEVGADELREYVRSQIAAYKYPRHVWLVDELPKTATGKILKREIQVPADLSAGTAAAGR
jgi:long-chain acyl-CoA synthetase